MPSPPPIFIVLAKRPDPGAVKTRLIAPGGLDAAGAAAVAEAMLRCTLRRLVAGGAEVVLAVTPDGCGPALRGRLGLEVGVCDQGSGDLGERLARLWTTVGAGRPVAFFGIDAPDVPAAAIDAIAPAIDEVDAAIGPTSDGGYWTLAARRPQPALLAQIDWGSASVYDQTRQRAKQAGIRLRRLPAWRDVDTPADLDALRQRLESLRGRPSLHGDEQPLLELADDLVALSGAADGTPHD